MIPTEHPFFFGNMVLDFALREGCAMTQTTKSKGSLLNNVTLIVGCCWFAPTIELHIVTSIIDFATVLINS